MSSGKPQLPYNDPNKTIEKIKELDTIIPGISNIYNHDEEIEIDDKQINSLILDFLKKK